MGGDSVRLTRPWREDIFHALFHPIQSQRCDAVPPNNHVISYLQMQAGIAEGSGPAKYFREKGLPGWRKTPPFSQSDLAEGVFRRR